MSKSSDNENLIIDAGDASRRLQIPLREGSAEEMMWPDPISNSLPPLINLLLDVYERISRTDQFP
jgi:hypothetical protein